MRKIFAVFAVVSAVFIMVMSEKTFAQTYCGSLEFIICEDEVIITGFEGEPEILDIPCKIEGKDVVEIRENAFYQCGSIKKVILPKTVNRIGHHAFYDCRYLERVRICGDVSVIEEGCFQGCTSLVEIELPQSLKKIECSSFFKCEKLKSISIPDSVIEIGNYAFSDCKNLSDLKLSENLINLGDFVFLNCEMLGEVRMPDSVMNIGSCSLGYTNKDGVLESENLMVECSGDSLGKKYASANGLDFKDVQNENEKIESQKPIAIYLSIASLAGLILLKIISNLSCFEKKYKYEQ